MSSPLRKQTERKDQRLREKAKTRQSAKQHFPPLTVSHPELLNSGTDDDFRQAVYLVFQVLSRMEFCRSAFGRAMNLSGSQFAVLMGVAYRQGDAGVKINELARHVQLASTHVTTEVGRLERQGFLNKRNAEDDRRSVLVSLTPKGEKAVIEVSPFLRRVNDLLFEGVSQAQLATVREVFAKLSLNSEFAIAEIKRTEREQQDPESF